MKKFMLTAVLAAIAGPSFAQTNFDSLAVSLADLKEAAAQNSSEIKPKEEKLKMDYVTKAERQGYIVRSQLWRPEGEFNTAAMDFKKGPYEKMKFAPEEVVNCSYVTMKEGYETGRPNGMSSKFKCRDAKGKAYKVKYGDAGDVMAEVAASWVLTGIGSYADRMYPVRLNCPDCPSDPFKDESDRGAWKQGQIVAIEEKLGDRIEDAPNSGIGFDEFYQITDKVGAEALTGMMQFLSNSDNKAPNQAMACQKGDVVMGPAGKAVCAKPVAYLQDLGITFGGRGWYHNSRMNFDKWKKEHVWEDGRNCIMHLNSTHTSSLKGVDPAGRLINQIGEQARQMMIRRLSMLSREQLVDIFTAARASQHAPSHSAQEWADLFLRKVDELRNPRGSKTPADFACPYQVVPPNSAPPQENQFGG
jgi:hypothetical protein